MKIKIRGTGATHTLFLFADLDRKKENSLKFLSDHGNASEYTKTGKNEVSMSEATLKRWRAIFSDQQKFIDFVLYLATKYSADEIRNAYADNPQIDEMPIDYRAAYARTFLESYFSRRGKIKIRNESEARP
jgi:hypothetical protein